MAKLSASDVVSVSSLAGHGVSNVEIAQFLDHAVRSIRNTLHTFMVRGIKYEKIAGETYEMSRFDESVEGYVTSMIDVTKNIYSAVEYESEVEKRFAQSLEAHDHIKLYLKLPPWFTVSTPIGTYNPDWAIVKKNPDALYLVRETKSTAHLDELCDSERDRIRCGAVHFNELGVDYKVVTSATEV